MVNEADRVRNLKKAKVLQINGLNFGRIIATRAYDPSIKNVSREFARMLLYQYKLSIKHKSNSELLFAYSYRGKGRSDFDNIIDSAYSYAEDNNIESDFLDCVYSFSLLNSLSIFKMFYYWIKFIISRVQHPLLIAILVSQFTKFEKNFKKILKDNNYKAVISFCDAHGVENELTQLAIKHGIKTATLQHGQYRIVDHKVENADIESYENFISDYLFSWGKVTQDEFASVGIDPSRILQAGAIKSFSNNTKVEGHENFGIFGVVLCGNAYNESNINMIGIANEIAKKYNMKYVLRLHPKNDESYYKKYCDTKYLKDCIRKIENYEYADIVDFSILHMTGVFVELLSINSPVFVFNDKYMAKVFLLEGATFQNTKDFYEIFSKYQNDRTSFLRNQYRIYRDYNCTSDLESRYLELYKQYLL